MLLGRMRSSSSALEVVEMERQHPCNKIIKHDSLSIYEATLLKLRQGSHSTPSIISQEESPTTDQQCCTMAVDTPQQEPSNAAAAHFSSPNACNTSQFSSKSKNMSILSFFSKCKTSQSSRADGRI